MCPYYVDGKKGKHLPMPAQWLETRSSAEDRPIGHGERLTPRIKLNKLQVETSTKQEMRQAGCFGQLSSLGMPVQHQQCLQEIY